MTPNTIATKTDHLPSPICWFEIITQDLPRAIHFYQTAFNIILEQTVINDIAMAIFPYTEGYAGGALVHSEKYSDHHAGPSTIIISLRCDNVTDQLKKIISLGGKEVFPVTPIGCGYIAGFCDTEGNYVGLWAPTC